MSPRQEMVGLLGAVLLMALIIELVRRQKLRTGYSLLWLSVGMLMLALVLLPGVVQFLADLVGIESSSSLLFTVGIVFTLFLVLGHSLTLTILWRQDKDLVQDHALLERRVRQLEARLLEVNSAHPAEPELEVVPQTAAFGHTEEDTNDATLPT